MRVGLGIVTFNRPGYFAQVADGVADNLWGSVDYLCVHNDASDEGHDAAYDRAYDYLRPDYVYIAQKNGGVAKAKNWVLRRMLAEGCDWLFVLEDDIVPQSSEAIGGYLRAAEESGWDHLAFAHHGPHNPRPLPNSGRPGVTLWPNWVGAYCMYSRRSLEAVGLMDERFDGNCWEHVEHTMRLALAGYAPRPPGAADATGSEDWLREIPGSIETSYIRQTADWSARCGKSLAWWKDTMPETYHLLWP